MTSLANYQTRPPWPDEWERLHSLLDGTGPDAPRRTTWYWILSIGGNERMVGAAALEEPAGLQTGSRLRLVLRPRFRDEPAAESLLQTALQKALDSSWRPVLCQFEQGKTPAKLLAKFGFQLGRVEHLWRAPIAALHARIAPFCHRLAPRLQRLGKIEICTPRDEHIPEIINVLKARGLLDSDELRFEDQGSDRDHNSGSLDPRGTDWTVDQSSPCFHRGYSNVVTINQQVAGVALTQLLNRRTGFTRYRAVAPAFNAHSMTINPFIMERPLALGIAQGGGNLFFTAREGSQDETAHMARKSQGQIVKSVEVFSLP
jgi:hypothetical protein